MRGDIQALLDEAADQYHQAFPDNVQRREQFDAHMATVKMVVDHAADEAERNADE